MSLHPCAKCGRLFGTPGIVHHEAVCGEHAASKIPGRTLGGNRTHGTRATYQAGCRCVDCREAERTYRAGYRRERADQ